MPKFLIRIFLILFLRSADSVDGHGFSESVDFEVKEGESLEKHISLESEEIDIQSPSSLLTVKLETSNPVKVNWFLTGNCVKSEVTPNVQISLEQWKSLMKCESNLKSIRFEISASEKAANGTLTLEENTKLYLISQFSPGTNDGNRFQVADNHPFLKKVKLGSLSDQVEIKLTSENVENSLEVYISFCPSNKGILYTTSYAPVLDILLKSPKMEVFYDAYSCDSNVTFYSNSTQPVSPLVIRLESKFATNGTITVIVNGEVPNSESHVADYEVDTFTVQDQDKPMLFELKYQSSMENVHAFFDVITGAISIHLSPCKSLPDDVAFGEFPVGSHRININLEELMSNTSCSLLEVHPSTVFLSIRPAHFSSATFSFWKPGSVATWHIWIVIGMILILLGVAMFFIIHFGRRKTGQLVINGY